VTTDPPDSPPEWREQYDQMCRWHARLAAASAVDLQLVDDFYAFCLVCFHLKDWLKNDASAEVDEKVVEQYVNGNLWLGLCADLANGAKHLKLRDRSRRFEGTHHPETTLVLDLGLGISLLPVKPALTIPLPPGERVTALRFVESCVDAWDEFLRTHGLLGPSPEAA
jgi:hypothetical protein